MLQTEAVEESPSPVLAATTQYAPEVTVVPTADVQAVPLTTAIIPVPVATTTTAATAYTQASVGCAKGFV